MENQSRQAKSIKHTVLKLFTLCRSRTKGTRVIETPKIQSRKSINSVEFVYPTNQLIELPSNDTHDNMTTSSSQTGLIQKLTEKDRWLGQKIFEVNIAAVTLRSLPTTASEEDVKALSEDLIRTFRYEECYKALCNQSEISQTSASFRDLLLGQIGHVHRQTQASSSAALGIDLEQYIDDHRRHQNEKFFIKQESDLDYTPEVQALLGAQISPVSPLETNIVIPSNTHDTQPVYLPSYTARLQEYASKQGISLLYTISQTQFQPEMFTCKVTFGNSQVTGPKRSRKKEAKHEASMALCNQLQVPLVI